MQTTSNWCCYNDICTTLTPMETTDVIREEVGPIYDSARELYARIVGRLLWDPSLDEAAVTAQKILTAAIRLRLALGIDDAETQSLLRQELADVPCLTLLAVVAAGSTHPSHGSETMH